MRQSKWFRIVITWVLVLCAAMITIEFVNLAVKYHDYNSQPPASHIPPQNNHSSSPVWGVDTAGKIDQASYKCISQNYGVPMFVGRYLGNNGDASIGLTKDEVQLLHSKKIKILLIHNRFKDAAGLKNGQSEANEAIKLAKAIGVKNGVILVADIEANYKVDSDFIIGWTKTLLNNNFIPGVYGNLEKDELQKAYGEAAKKDKNVRENMILWTNQPSVGVTGRKNAPNEFKGKSPNPKKTLVWQYGIDSKKCNIDTDFGKANLLDLLW